MDTLLLLLVLAIANKTSERNVMKITVIIVTLIVLTGRFMVDD